MVKFNYSRIWDLILACYIKALAIYRVVVSFFVILNIWFKKDSEGGQVYNYYFINIIIIVLISILVHPIPP